MDKKYFGAMIDMSRNAVMKVSEVKKYIDYGKILLRSGNCKESVRFVFYVFRRALTCDIQKRRKRPKIGRFYSVTGKVCANTR